MGGAAILVWVVLEAATLTSAQTGIMRAEVETIWAPYSVHFVWRDRLPDDGEDRELAILLRVGHQDIGPARDRRYPPLGAVERVGRTLRREVRVSEPGVRALVQRSVPLSMAGAPTRFYPRMLGRVVAHEVGHLLLNSTTHARGGLMRARFGTADVLTDGPERYRLDDAQQLKLASWRVSREEVLVAGGK
jgi:hypothetical protein